MLSLSVLFAAAAALLLSMPGPMPPDAAAAVVLSGIVVASIAVARRYYIIGALTATMSIVLSMAAAALSAPIIPMMSQLALPHLFLILIAALNIALAGVLLLRRQYHALATLAFAIGVALLVLLVTFLTA